MLRYSPILLVIVENKVRRSATICIFSKDDNAMMNAKTGSWFFDNPQRARSNNSVALLRDDTSYDEFETIMESVKEFGEPGFIWMDNLNFMFNPCVTKDTKILTSGGTKLVSDLIGKKFKAIVDGKEYESKSNGFWKTGQKNIFKLSTLEGYDLKLTDNHELLCVVNNEKIWKQLKDIKTGDKIQLNNNIDYFDGIDDNNIKDYEIGWLLGCLISDGTFDDYRVILRFWDEKQCMFEKAVDILNKYFERYYIDFMGFLSKNNRVAEVSSTSLYEFVSEFNITAVNKYPNDKIYSMSDNFIYGYIQGMFDFDGSVQGNTDKSVSIRLTQVNINILKQIQLMLLNIGINSKIYKNRGKEGLRYLPDGRGRMKEYYCKVVHELIISKDNIKRFFEIINFSHIVKKMKLELSLNSYKRAMNKDDFLATVDSIVDIGKEDVYDVTISDVHCFSGNGIIAHNCCEIGMYPKTQDNRYGYQLCNLVEINGSKSITKEIFFEQCKYAAILGTLQAGYTEFKFLKDATREIVERESLIGVGITGMMNNPGILFNKDIVIKGAEIVKEWNKKISQTIGINQAARTTCIKPSGNSAVLLESSSGIHGEHSETYLRHVQFNKSSEVAKLLMKENPEMCSKSVYNKERDVVVAFPVNCSKESKFKKNLLGVKQLEYVKLIQQTWVEYGTNVDLCTDPRLRHNVSNTITVDDWNSVTKYIYNNRNYLCGVALLPLTGDKIYPQAPFVEILKTEDIIGKYGMVSLFTSALIEAGLLAFNSDLWLACSTALGAGEKIGEGHNGLLKKDFVRRFKKFAKHFENENECANCLKDLHNLHKLWKIDGNIKNINWTKQLSKKEFIDIGSTVATACGGGDCEV